MIARRVIDWSRPIEKHSESCHSTARSNVPTEHSAREPDSDAGQVCLGEGTCIRLARAQAGSNR